MVAATPGAPSAEAGASLFSGPEDNNEDEEVDEEEGEDEKKDEEEEEEENGEEGEEEDEEEETPLIKREVSRPSAAAPSAPTTSVSGPTRYNTRSRSKGGPALRQDKGKARARSPSPSLSNRPTPKPRGRGRPRGSSRGGRGGAPAPSVPPTPLGSAPSVTASSVQRVVSMAEGNLPDTVSCSLLCILCSY